MARALFTNEQLCVAWKAALESDGVRMDVVLALMDEADVEDTPDNRKRFYSIVSQRVKSLTDSGLTLQPLNRGRQGGTRANISSLQAILDGVAEEQQKEDEGEGEGDEE